jgi:lysophospholipase L1-like esterase
VRRVHRFIGYAALVITLMGCGDDGGGDPGAGGSGGTTAGAGGATTGGAGSSGSGGGGASGAAGSGATGGASGASGASGGGGVSGSSAGTGGASGTGGNSGESGAAGASGGSGGAGGSAGSAAGESGAAGASGAAGGTSVAGPRFLGRFAPDGRFSWSGTGIDLAFYGSEISVTLEDPGDNFLEVIVDGEATTLELMPGMNTYELASGLADGAHRVTLHRRTEAFFEPTRFVSFSVPESAYLSVPVPERRLEIVGDSITAGYGNEDEGPSCPFVAATENHYQTYGAIAARELGVDLHTEAWSGIGMYREYGGATTDQMPVRFLRAIPTDAASTWDFSSYVPHAVVINLGTNDFSTGDPGAPFATAYETFVTDLRGHYPDARFYLAVGPMLSGANYDAAKAHLENVIAARAADGDTNLGLIEFSPIDQASEGLGCDYHPTIATNERMADTLVARLRADLGW